MRNPKRPTREQKKKIVAAGLDWMTWLVLEEDSQSMVLISKKSGRRRVLMK